MANAFQPVTPYVLTGWTGLYFTLTGLAHNNTREIIGGLAVIVLSGFIDIYKQGAFNSSLTSIQNT